MSSVTKWCGEEGAHRPHNYADLSELEVEQTVPFYHCAGTV